MLLEISRPLLIVIIAVGALVLTAGFILLFIYVLLPNSYKKQVRALEKRFSYLDSLLIGTVSQYIYRIEIISRNNLLYIDKHETFSHRYKAILDTEDKYSESMIKQLNSLIANKKFKNIKAAINEAKKALNIFDENLSSLYNDLKAVIQLEEDCRKQIDTLKETYRRVKQTYYAESAELEMVAKTFNKLFTRIDETFTELDKLIESAEYDEINDQLPDLEKVLNALGKALLELPNLCALTKTVVTEKIAQIQVKYAETEKKGVPLYHLGFKGQVEDWKKRLDALTKRIINLQCSGVQKECDLILAEINRVSKQLDDEIAAKAYFKENYEDVYRKVKDVRNTFIKIHSMIPNIEKIYMISSAQKERIAELFTAVTNLDNSKKNLDSFYMSGVRQPFSLLKNQLDELKANYEVVAAGVEEFKNYIESLKSTAEDAYKMIFVYYARIKEIEKVLADINIQDLRDSYQEKINAIYEILNYIYDTIQSKPINVEEIANKIEQLKNVSNALFEEIDDKSRHCFLAENLLVSLNSMAKEQDVAQSLEQLEAAFMKGEFESVYRQADAIYRSKIASDHE